MKGKGKIGKGKSAEDECCSQFGGELLTATAAAVAATAAAA